MSLRVASSVGGKVKSLSWTAAPAMGSISRVVVGYKGALHEDTISTLIGCPLQMLPAGVGVALDLQASTAGRKLAAVGSLYEVAQ